MNDSGYWDLHAKGVRAVNDLRFAEAEQAFEDAGREARARGLSGLSDRAFCNAVGVRLQRTRQAGVQGAQLSEILGSSEDAKARQLAAYYLADVLRLQGKLRPAKLYAEMAVRLAEREGDLSGQASSRDFLGLLALGDSRLEEAHENLSRSLEVSRRIGAAPVILITMSTLGYCQSLMGRWKESLGFLEESRRMLGEDGPRLYAPSARINLGFAFLEHEALEQTIEQGESVLTSLDGSEDLAKYAHFFLGEAYARRGSRGLAAEHFEILQKTWYPQYPDLLEVLLSFRNSRLLNWLAP